MKWRVKCLTVSLALLSSQSFAGGFQLSEHNSSGLGNAYAGAGALGEDASTNFYNPAALSCLPNAQVLLSGVFINLNEDVKITSSTLTTGLGTADVLGNDRAEAAGWAALPAIHVAVPWCNFVFGLGVDIPYGLSTSYPISSKSRYFATHTQLSTLNVGPTVAYVVNDWFSIGGGFDAEYADATLKQQILTGAGDATIKNEVNSWGYGWNLGVMFNFNNGCTRIGAHYRSQVNQSLEGDASLKNANAPNGGLALAGDAEATLKLPDSANISIVQEINPCWAILGSVYYTHWGVIDTLTLNYKGALSTVIPRAQLALNFKDAFKYALAVNFTPDDCWKLRLGVAYDESPVQSQYDRSFRLPDNNRVWLSTGVQYHASDCLVFDVGYSHIFKADTKINQTITIPGGVLNARAEDDGSANLFGVQVAWNFV